MPFLPFGSLFFKYNWHSAVERYMCHSALFVHVKLSNTQICLLTVVLTYSCHLPYDIQMSINFCSIIGFGNIKDASPSSVTWN